MISMGVCDVLVIINVHKYDQHLHSRPTLSVDILYGYSSTMREDVSCNGTNRHITVLQETLTTEFKESTIFYDILRHVTICCDMLRDVAICYDILRYVTRCYEMLRDVFELTYFLEDRDDSDRVCGADY